MGVLAWLNRGLPQDSRTPFAPDSAPKDASHPHAERRALPFSCCPPTSYPTTSSFTAFPSASSCPMSHLGNSAFHLCLLRGQHSVLAPEPDCTMAAQREQQAMHCCWAAAQTSGLGLQATLVGRVWAAAGRLWAASRHAHLIQSLMRCSRRLCLPCWALPRQGP